MSFSIGGLAEASGVNVETIRYYQRRGLLAEPARPPGGIRRYQQADVRRLRFIKRAQALGFSLAEVGELLALDDGRHCHDAEVLGAQKLVLVRERIAQLRRVEKALSGMVMACRKNSNEVRCPMIEALESPSDAR